MDQKMHTIPVVEAYESGDECPFCYLQRQTEQRAIRYFAGPGASYMEPSIRGITNRSGFCDGHMKKLYDYGNALGSALMIQTHYEDMMEDLKQQMKSGKLPEKKGLFQRKNQTQTPFWSHLNRRLNSCAVCDQVENNMQRQYKVFFDLLKEEEFRQMISSSKGFCYRHFARILQEAEQHLPDARREWFYETVYDLMEQNLQRVKDDLDWLIAKYDYRNAGAPWGNSRDALQRSMQKLNGIYPADPPYRKD